MTEMMKAAIFVEPGKMAVEEVPKATLEQDDDIVIRVVRTCVCGSDLWFFRGLSGQAAHSQVGHESIGVVEEVGAAVESVKPGDFVVVPFPYSCGKCPVCKAGFESVCPHGGYFSACQAEYLRVPEADGTVVKVPGSPEDYDDATLASLLTVSDVMSTGYHAAVSAEVKPGDFVVVPFPYSCGKCPVCKAGFESVCPHGGYFSACQAEYLRVPEADGTVVKVPGSPEDYSDEQLASLLTISDVMSTGYHAAVSAEVKPGDTAVVMGDGAVGLCGVIAAKMRGATRVIAMSRHEDRAALAREFGATDIVPERGQEAIDKVLEMTGGYGADAVLECVGSKQSFDTAIGLIRRGGVIGRVGLPHDVEISAEGTFYGNIGIKGGPAPVRHYDLDDGLLDAVLKGEINPGRVFTAEYDLDHIQDAYEAMDQRKVIKALIRL